MLTAIINHLWQSTLFAVALASLAVTLRKHGAHIRYWVWWTASVKFLVPFSLLAQAGDGLAMQIAPIALFGTWPHVIGRLAEPMPESSAWTPLMLTLIGVWASGFLVVAAADIVQLRRARALLRTAVPFAGPLPTLLRPLQVRIVSAPFEPALIGVFRPVLLLPQGIAERLSPAQLDSVLAHEVSHSVRRDNLTGAVHMVVEALFWFHPVIWWIGARLLEERERACDEAVIQAGHDRQSYADAILVACEHYLASRFRCASGISSKNLSRRIVEIARSRVVDPLSLQKKLVLATFTSFVFLVPIILGAVVGSAAAQDDRNVIPITRVPPDYPPDAVRAGREGWVRLRFTIAKDGSTKNVVAVESSSPEFEAPSIAALLQWRYSPPTKRSRAVQRRGVETMIRYQLSPDRP